MKKRKVAFITGILGQDGSYLAELLVSKGYEVHGLVYKTEAHTPLHENEIPRGVILHEGDLKDIGTLRVALKNTKPDEVYNLAGITDLATAKKYPHDTIEINYYGFGRLVNEALAVNPKVRILQAGSSQMFRGGDKIKNEETLLEGTEPYNESKILAQEDFVNRYRKERKAFICSAYLFNHESRRRDARFVTHKIIETFRDISKGKQTVLEIGNLEAKKDWGFAGDYVEAMWMMLQAERPNDYVIATGKVHSIRDFVEETARAFDIYITWDGKGLNEVGKDGEGNIIVRVNKDYYKKDTSAYTADISKIKSELGWVPKTSFQELISLMAEEKK